MGDGFQNEISFHQPAYASSTRKTQLKRFIKVRFRNTVKYALYFTGLYKSRISRREIADQIDAVVHLAKHQSKRIMWVQHQALQSRRIFLERQSYEKYYKEILEALKKHESSTFKLVTLPDDFLIQDNYLYDCIHLSELGHRELADQLKVAFKQLQAASIT